MRTWHVVFEEIALFRRFLKITSNLKIAVWNPIGAPFGKFVWTSSYFWLRWLKMMLLWWICLVVVSKLVSTTRWKAYILRLYRKGWGLAVYFAPPSVYCYWALSSALLCYHFASPVYIIGPSLTPIALLPPGLSWIPYFGNCLPFLAFVIVFLYLPL